MDPQASGTRTWQWVVTIIVIIVLIVIGILVFGGKGSETGDVTDGTSTTTNGVNSTAPNRITMTDQYPGNRVYLSAVQLEKPGYVAIHKNNNGQPGDVIGYAKFDKGINPGSITLTTPLVDGTMYFAVLHNDDGDATFDAVKDAPLKDANGNVIMRTFRASVDVSAGIKG